MILNFLLSSRKQIHSTLVYYWDHQEELDADMEQRYQFAEKLRREAGESPIVEKLRASGQKTN